MTAGISGGIVRTRPAPAPRVTVAPNQARRPAIDFDAIPAELRELLQWVLWRCESRNGDKPAKVPYQSSGKPARSNDPSTWGAFADVRRAFEKDARWSGIGIMLAGDLAGLDADRCVDEQGHVAALVQGYADRLNSYTEITPSGRGLRVLFRGRLPASGRKNATLGLELYDASAGRFFTVTGQHVAGTPTTIEHRESVAAAIHAEVFAPRPEPDPWRSRGLSLAAMRLPRPPIAWVLDRVLARRSVNLLYSPPGGFKTMVAAGLAASVASGQPFLAKPDGTGGLAVEQGAVVWVDYDSGEDVTVERLAAFAAAHGLPEDAPITAYCSPNPVFDASDPVHVAAMIERCQGAALIVIDTLTHIKGGIDSNSDDMTAVMAGLRELAERTGAAVLVLHHQRKTQAGNLAREGDSIRGSSAIEAGLDSALMVQRDGRRVTIRPTKSRRGEIPTLSAEFAFENGPDGKSLASARFWPCESPTDLKHAEQERRIESDILALLADREEPASKALIEREVTGKREAIRQALFNLRQAGKITMAGGQRGASVFSLRGAP